MDNSKEPKIIEDDSKLEPANHEVFASKKEAMFIEYYRKGSKVYNIEAGNATKAALKIFDCKDKASASAIGSRLVKKFGLKSTKKIIPKEIIEERFEGETFTGPLPDGKWNQMKEIMKDKDGRSNKDVFNEVETIAFKYGDKSTALRALAQLKSWNDELKQEREAQDMADKDIVELLARALGKIPREKYVEVLQLCRQIRLKVINERNRELDVDAIVDEILKQKMNQEIEET